MNPLAIVELDIGHYMSRRLDLITECVLMYQLRFQRMEERFNCGIGSYFASFRQPLVRRGTRKRCIQLPDLSGIDIPA